MADDILATMSFGIPISKAVIGPKLEEILYNVNFEKAMLQQQLHTWYVLRWNWTLQTKHGTANSLICRMTIS